jgi:putative membrane protein
VLSSSLLSTLHLLALAIGLPGVALRGLGLRALRNDPTAITTVLRADAAWGIGALLWLSTGLVRAFGPFEKGTAYYLSSGLFLVKLGLFVLVLLLELWPMITLIRWRIAQGKGLPVGLAVVPKLIRVNDLELAVTLTIPFLASAMARGLGFFLR